MALFHKSPSGSDSDRIMLQKMEHFYNESLTTNQAYWAEAEIDTKFEAGDQALWNDIYSNLPSHHRKNFNFNRIRRSINMVTGHQRKNRKSTIVVPVENADEVTADQFTKILSWVNRQEGVLETISDAFHGALVSGMNLLQVWVDYRNDPISGNIKVDNCSYNSFLIDPFFRKKDLSDCNGLWKRSFLTRRECMSLMPDYASEIEKFPANERDGKFGYLPENFDMNLLDLMTYDEFYYRDYRKQKMLTDSVTGEVLEWKMEDVDKLDEFLRSYPQITVMEQEVPTVSLAVVVQGNVMYNGRNPLEIDTYPFVPVFGYYNPQISDFALRIQGMVRGLRDSQYLYNRRKIIELDILESQINSGWKFKENALVDPKDVFMSGQGRGVALKQDAQMTDVEQIQAPQIPPSMLEISNSLSREILEISGINEELLGSAVDEKAGVLAMLRQGAGLTTLQILFDQLDYSQKLLGKILIPVIQNHFTPGKIQRIIEEEPSPQFYNKAFGIYDASVESGLNTDTQKQMAFAQMMELRNMGIPIPDEVLLENVSFQNKPDVLKAMEKEQQAKQQMEQQQAQVQMQEQQARTELAHARAKADMGLFYERTSRIAENKSLAVERVAQAETDRTQSTLNMIKAIKELDDMDTNNLAKLIGLARSFKADELIEEKVATQESPASVGDLLNNDMNPTQSTEVGQF